MCTAFTNTAVLSSLTLSLLSYMPSGRLCARMKDVCMAPITSPALARVLLMMPGLRFWGIAEEPYAADSSSSIQGRVCEYCCAMSASSVVMRIATLAAIPACSSGTSKRLTWLLSSEFSIGPSKPSSSARRGRESGQAELASTAEPSAERLTRAKPSRSRSKSRSKDSAKAQR